MQTTLTAKINYTPIDYSKWDFSGKGKNILQSLSDREKFIWYGVFPFQDSRDDPGHAEVVTYFALKLLDYSLGGNKKIVIPAAILHDSGYNIGGKEFRKLCEERRDAPLRLEHQVRSSLIAYELLSKNEYSPEEILDIMRIILNHDTRIREHGRGSIELFFRTSQNDRVVRDADVLWRFTLPQAKTYSWNKTECKEKMEEELAKDNLYFDISKQIAKTELENTVRNLSK